jgi:hypothetical protein
MVAGAVVVVAGDPAWVAVEGNSGEAGIPQADPAMNSMAVVARIFIRICFFCIAEFSFQ